jgi:hypothetical protein
MEVNIHRPLDGFGMKLQSSSLSTRAAAGGAATIHFPKCCSHGLHSGLDWRKFGWINRDCANVPETARSHGEPPGVQASGAHGETRVPEAKPRFAMARMVPLAHPVTFASRRWRLPCFMRETRGERSYQRDPAVSTALVQE